MANQTSTLSSPISISKLTRGMEVDFLCGSSFNNCNILSSFYHVNLDTPTVLQNDQCVKYISKVRIGMKNIFLM